MLSASAILALVREGGGRLEPAEADRVAFVGPAAALTEQLREGIDANRNELLDRLRHKTPAELVGEACAAGFWLKLQDGEIRAHPHDGVPPALHTELLERIQANKAAVSAFLEKPIADYTPSERAALGLSDTFQTDWLKFAWWKLPYG